MAGALLLEVGCLECGNETTVIGTYSTVEEAKAVREPNARYGWRLPTDYDVWHGQSVLIVVDLDVDPPAIVAVG